MDTKIRNIVVGVACGDGTDPVLRPAVRLASQLDATLHVVHGFEFPAPVLEAYASLGYEYDSIGTDYADRTEAEIIVRARELDPGARIVMHAVHGSPASEVPAYAHEIDADLLMVGSTHHGKVGRIMLGTTAERIIRQAGRPVLVVRDGKDVNVSRALITTDLSHGADATFDLAMNVLGAMTLHRPELRCLYAVWHGATLPPPVRGQFVREVAEGDLTDFLEQHGEQAADVEGRVRIGTAAEEITREARDWDADLVVLGTHRRTTIGRFLLGSVAAAVVRDAPCHALVVPVLPDPVVAPDTETEAQEAVAT